LHIDVVPAIGDIVAVSLLLLILVLLPQLLLASLLMLPSLLFLEFLLLPASLLMLSVSSDAVVPNVHKIQTNACAAKL